MEAPSITDSPKSPKSPKNRARPSTAWTASSPLRYQPPRLPLYADISTLPHGPVQFPSPSPLKPAFGSPSIDRPQSPPATATDPVSYFQHGLSSTDTSRTVEHSDATTDQGWPRTGPGAGEEGGGAPEDEVFPDLRLSHRSTRRRDSTKTSGSGSSRFFRSIVEKFGRSFNKNYWLPSDKQEQERMNLQHEISIEAHDGNLHLCPAVKPKRVLDVGTGTGIWALDFARRNPDSEVIGVDLNSVPQPPFVLPNCHFYTADVYDEWTFGSSFDLIHVRSLGEPTDKHKLFKSIYDNLEPGGWVEFQEWILNAQSSDRSLDGTAFEKWNRLISEGLKNLGRSLFYILEYKRVMEKAGFENIVERKYAVPTNTWPPGKQSQRIGAMQKSNMLQVIDIWSLGVFTQGLGWSKEALERLLVDVRRDIENTRIHSYSTLMTVYCRKPNPNQSSSASLESVEASHWQHRQSMS
ncbi:hypothetical protein M426DRAFT_322914 [Hypoxylon sp. CI-4A]|nr:hypothetical protein M426DRAFT_322914 [Hypoxylon sp. CI-4A]